MHTFVSELIARRLSLHFRYVIGHSEVENDDGNDVIYEYDFPEVDTPFDRKSVTSREFSRRRARFRRQAGDYSARGDYQYPDDDLMTSSPASGAPSSERHGNNGSDVSSDRQTSLPTDPEVRLN